MPSDGSAPDGIDVDRGTVVALERLCAVGNGKACETLERLCEEGYAVACRGVRDA
jgi:hypothetical protein